MSQSFGYILQRYAVTKNTGLFLPPTSSITVYWVKGFKPLATASADKPV